MAQTKFFITHSWQDIDFAKQLCNDLRAHGLDGFFDAYSIQPGDDIAGRIAHGLENCDVYVPLLSPAAVASKWCELEINTAINLSMEAGRDGKPRIIPVVIKPCKLPTLLRGKLYINFDGRYNDALNELLGKGFRVPPKLPMPPPASAYVAMPSLSEPSFSERFASLSAMQRLLITTIGLGIGVFAFLVLIIWFVTQLTASVSFTPTRIAQASSTLELPPNTVVPVVLPANTPTSLPTPVTPTSSPTNTMIPTSTPRRAMPTSTATPTITPTPTLGIVSKTSTDGAVMVYVPAGKFWMGSSDADKQAKDDEKPQHEVDLDAFWIDKFEVTNALYKKCVDSGVCSVPIETKSDTRNVYYGNTKYDNYPVENVSLEQARRYCEYFGKRLPTEAQWEKSARGTDRRIYPWGNELDGSRLNFCDTKCPSRPKDETIDDEFADIAPVGNYSRGVSPYGAMDLAGNVWEWTADWYDENYYKDLPSKNPIGPSTEKFPVLRGGSYGNTAELVRAASRSNYGAGTPTSGQFGIGFRCAQ